MRFPYGHWTDQNIDVTVIWWQDHQVRRNIHRICLTFQMALGFSDLPTHPLLNQTFSIPRPSRITNERFYVYDTNKFLYTQDDWSTIQFKSIAPLGSLFCAIMCLCY
jgi:hypothetical protein